MYRIYPPTRPAQRARRYESRPGSPRYRSCPVFQPSSQSRTLQGGTTSHRPPLPRVVRQELAPTYREWGTGSRLRTCSPSLVNSGTESPERAFAMQVVCPHQALFYSRTSGSNMSTRIKRRGLQRQPSRRSSMHKTRAWCLAATLRIPVYK